MGEKKSEKQKAVGVIIKSLDTQKILLVKRSNAHHKFVGQWSIPAGQMEIGENDIETLKRETFEETKIITMRPSGESKANPSSGSIERPFIMGTSPAHRC